MNTPTTTTGPILKSGRVTHLSRLAGVLGLAGLGGCVLLMLVDGTRAAMAPAYLVAYTFWFGIALGGLMLTMLHHLSGGVWGLLARRPLEAASLVLIPLALLFIPIAISADVLYPWSWTGAKAAADPFAHVIAEKTAYLNLPGFLLRTVGYFALWIVLALVMNAGSRRQDETVDRAPRGGSG